jgi:hypothetical protein
MYTGFSWVNRRERDHLEDTGIDGMITLRRIFRKCDGGMDWIDMARDRDRWRTVVNAAMSLLISSNGGNFLAS